MHGKVVMVTGGNTGIGKVTALELARKGATVVIVSRSKVRGEAALAQIKATTGSDSLHLMLADISSQESIRSLAAQFRQRFDRLDVLVNNAGATFAQRLESVDGIEMTFALNHLGYFSLTMLLLDLLKASAPSRIVCVSSHAHRYGRLHLEDLEFRRRRYGEWTAYSESKLANLLFVFELARRLEGTGVTVNALHPGTVRTQLFTGLKGLKRLVPILIWPFLIPPEKGADTSIYLASSPDVEGVSGQYFHKRQPVRASAAALDSQEARQLWEISERLTGLTY